MDEQEKQIQRGIYQRRMLDVLDLHRSTDVRRPSRMGTDAAAVVVFFLSLEKNVGRITHCAPFTARSAGHVRRGVHVDECGHSRRNGRLVENGKRKPKKCVSPSPRHECSLP
jgi:hypothetical protein